MLREEDSKSIDVTVILFIMSAFHRMPVFVDGFHSSFEFHPLLLPPPPKQQQKNLPIFFSFLADEFNVVRVTPV